MRQNSQVQCSDEMKEQCSIISSEFTCFGKAQFPGTKESTSLTKNFASQGIRLPIRNNTGGQAN
jgi:hypothetical protein